MGGRERAAIWVAVVTGVCGIVVALVHMMHEPRVEPPFPRNHSQVEYPEWSNVETGHHKKAHLHVWKGECQVHDTAGADALL